MDIVNTIFDFFYRRYYNEDKRFSRSKINLQKKNNSIFL